ncbi:MAG: SDR family NAD(P)-dependent oxidoreductase [Clostridiaceae bacterium]|nr:SDR family NAD(P)-dependent oxidoreductase [Clostridiaceae bacterium]
MGQNVFISGADRGLGFALTKIMVENNWNVFAGAYMPQWTELKELAEIHPINLKIIPLDVSADASVKKAAELVSKSTDIIDMIINNAGISGYDKDIKIKGSQDFNEIQKIYNTNSIGPIRVIEAFLPLIDKSKVKRLCFVSSEAGSINAAQRDAWYGYCMSKAALNMGVKILFNRLRPEGYTFRLYHPGWIQTYMSGKKNTEADFDPDRAALNAIAYFMSKRCNKELENEEDRLVMRDWKGSEWPW